MKPLRLWVSMIMVISFLVAPFSGSRSQTAMAAPDASTTIVISQVYSGGGGSTGTYIHDYVELFNISTSSQSLDGMSLQYGSATGNFASSSTNIYAFLAGVTIPPRGYLLIQLGAAGSGGVALPVTPDIVTGNLSMGAVSGKVALARIAAALGCGATATPCALPHANIVDLVAWGTANNAEGGVSVNNGVGLTNTQGSVRLGSGCKDTDNNFADFAVITAPVPRNSSSPAGICLADPSVTKIGPAQASPGDTIEYILEITNNGYGPSDSILITDTLPADVAFITYTTSVPITYTGFTSPELTWEMSSLAVAASTLITVQVEILPTMPDSIVNTVAIGTNNANNSSTSNDLATSTTEYPKPALSVTKSGPTAAIGGMDIIYTIDLQNTGSLTATNVVVTDTLTGGAAYVGDTTGVTPTIVGPDILSWNLGDFAPGINASYLITYTADLTPTRDITNTVIVSTDTALDDPIDNLDTVVSHVYGLSTIAEARAGTNGTIFAVVGKVTVPPGVYQPREWVMQDDTGGIGVFYNSPPILALGDTVVLVAPRGSFSGQEQMGTPLYYQHLGPGTPLSPNSYPTGDVAAGDTEGWLVQVEGTVSGLGTCSTTSNYQFNIDDGSGSTVIFVDQDTDIDVCAMGVTNGTLIRVTGFSTEFNGLFEIKPRFASDVVFTQPEIIKDAPPVVAPGQVYTYTLTASNHLGFDLSDVVITDMLPADTELARILDGGTLNGSEVTWNISTLANNASMTVRFAVTATTELTAIVNLDYAIVASNFVTPTQGIPETTYVTADGTLAIHHVQGSGDASLLAGEYVLGVEGFVVNTTNDGFFMQDPAPDSDDNTSEGIFVFTGSAPGVGISDTVSVDGLVSEFNELTELKNVTITPVVLSGTITPIELTFPIDIGTSLEPLEGMWVTIPHSMTISQNFFQGRYGQLTLSADGRMYNPTNGNGLGDTFELDTRRMLILDDGSNAQNPNVVPYMGDQNTSRAGDTVVNLNGVLDQGIINSSGAAFYRLHPLSTEVPVFTRVNVRTTAPEDVGGNIQVASFNVLNYFNGNGLGGGFPTSRGADTLLEFMRQRTKIITAMVAIDADVFGLMEIENDGTGDLSAIHDLVTGLNLLVTDPYTYTVEPAPGTDEIKVAMIYKPGVVTPVGPAQNFQITTHPTYVPLFDRPPLAQTFMVNETGEIFTVIVNHFKSKGSCPVAGPDTDQGDGQGCWNVKRTAQAEGLLDIINQVQTNTGDQDVLVIGDLNSYGLEDPVLAFLAGGLTNLSETYVSDEERYTYVFDGLSGQLDHALGTSNLASQAAGVVIWHINTDEPTVIDYDMDFNPDGYYTPTPYRSSDHDPVIIGLDLLAPADLDLSLVDSPDPISGMGTVTYTLTIENIGQTDAAGVALTLDVQKTMLPALTILSLTTSQGTCDGGLLTCDLGTITAGGSATITLVIKAPLAAGTITVDAEAVTTSPELALGNNFASGSTLVKMYQLLLPIITR